MGLIKKNEVSTIKIRRLQHHDDGDGDTTIHAISRQIQPVEIEGVLWIFAAVSCPL